MKIKDGDVDAWLRRISWDTLNEWLKFMEEEPIGEERADLRAGALASVIWNTNIDTKKLGGLVEPLGYMSGFSKDRVCILTIKPKEEDIEDKIGTDEDHTVNNPIVWQNFKTNLIKSRGGIKR